jgi:hypothetical protein
MATVESTQRRLAARAQRLETWAGEHAVELRYLDDGQQWLVFAALTIRDVLSGLPALMRMLTYMLAHSGMDLPGPVIAAIAGVSDRAVRATKALTAAELLKSVQTPPRGRGQPKLGPEHVGALAKFLFEHPKAKVRDILEFIHAELDVVLDRLTLRRYIQRYGLGLLMGERMTDSPLLSEAQTLEEPFS